MWQWTIKKAEGQKNWFFWTVVLEKTLECPLSCKEIKPVNPKGNQSWTVTGRTNTEAEAPILWPPDAKNWLIEKTLMLGKIEGGKRRDNRGWDVWMASPTQHEFEQTPGMGKDGEAWCAAVHGVTKSWPWPSNWTTQGSEVNYLKSTPLVYCLCMIFPANSKYIQNFRIQTLLTSNILLQDTISSLTWVVANFPYMISMLLPLVLYRLFLKTASRMVLGKQKSTLPIPLLKPFDDFSSQLTLSQSL